MIDVRIGAPTRDVVATWASSADAMIADGLATALFFTVPDRLADEGLISSVRLLADGRFEPSGDFDGELFP